MIAALLSFVSPLAFVAPAAAGFAPALAAAMSVEPEQPADNQAALIGLTNIWVQSWNERNLERMQQLHGPGMLYGFGDRFVTGEALIADLRRENFFGLSWSLRPADLNVRMLSPEAAIVSFRLVGQEFRGTSARPYLALFTLIFQRQQGQWKIVHVHDSDDGSQAAATPQAEP